LRQFLRLDKKHYIYDVLFTAENADLTLVITGGTQKGWRWSKDARRAFTVSTKQMDDNLPTWRDMIDNIPDSSSHDLPVVDLPKGTPLMFWYLACAAHRSSTDGTPFLIKDNDIGDIELRDLAKVCHRFNAVHLVVANVPGWIEKNYPPGWRLSKPDEICGQLEHLWIAYVFGLEEVFHDVWYGSLLLSQGIWPDFVFLKHRAL
jgi:hypothetical protein